MAQGWEVTVKLRAMQKNETDTALSTEASSTLASDTPSECTSLVVSTAASTPALNTDLQISFPAFGDAFRSFQGLGAEISRLQIENRRLVEHNAAIEKELEILNEHNTAVEKELETLKEENIELSEAKDDAIKKLAEVEEGKAGLQKELDGLGELKDVMGWKKKCEELENRAIESEGKMEKLFEDYQQKIEQRIADAQTQSQNKLEQEINQIKTDHTLQMQSLASAMGFQGLEDMTDGYIVREKPFERIPGGMIQVSRAKVKGSDGRASSGPPREDQNTRFLYVMRDQYKDFKYLDSRKIM
ncbi:hypothetical protein BZA77DRAFT_292232 [Pyronema omphalodes]|nr:hypothetical protein BZA77DRAFT_292232 [Pyronema omphalodes]